MKKLMATLIVALFAAATFAAGSSATSGAAQIYKKARTSRGLCQKSGDAYPLATVAVKIGAMNKSKGTVKVAMTITPFFGKKQSASKVMTPDAGGNISDTLSFKATYGDVQFNIIAGYEEYENEDDGTIEPIWWYYWEATGNGYEIWESYTGGYIQESNLYFSAYADEWELPEDYDLITDPPQDVPFYVQNGKKFTFDKAPSVSYKRFRDGSDTWYELVGLDDEDKPNVNALKLSYKPKDGSFSGSFKLYASNEGVVDEGKKPKIVKYTAKVKGVIMDFYGWGAGQASVKIGKQTFTWPVEIHSESAPWNFYALAATDSSESTEQPKAGDADGSVQTANGEELDPADVGAAAYGRIVDCELVEGDAPDTYDGDNPLVDAFLDLSRATMK